MGSIYKRGKTWSITFDIRQHADGKRKQVTKGGFHTKKEAQAALAEALTQIFQGTYVMPTKQTFAQLVEVWATEKQTKVKPNTWATYKSKIYIHVLPRIGHLSIRDIHAQHIQRLFHDIRTAGRADQREGVISEHSLLHIHRIINNIFELAVKWDLISRNPCKYVAKPRPKHREMQVWTVEQVWIFLETAKDEPLYPLFLILLTTGVRKGEGMGLRWSDVDLETAHITVRRQLSFVKGGYLFQSVKSKASNRRLPIPSEVVSELRKIKEAQEHRRAELGEGYQSELDLVIATPTGSPYYHGHVTKKWNEIIERAGLPRIRIHDARHTHATLLLQQGVHPKIVQERLGHEDISVTLNLYSHVMPGMQEKVVEDFAATLFGKNTVQPEETKDTTRKYRAHLGKRPLRNQLRKNVSNR